MAEEQTLTSSGVAAGAPSPSLCLPTMRCAEIAPGLYLQGCHRVLSKPVPRAVYSTFSAGSPGLPSPFWLISIFSHLQKYTGFG